MLISDFAIKRPTITVVTMLALVVGGIIALIRLQTDEFPEVAPPYVSVAVPYPGASPDAAGEVTESTIANVVVEKSGRKATPPIRCGLLPGTYEVCEELKSGWIN